jgi:hypothetical protein
MPGAGRTFFGRSRSRALAALLAPAAAVVVGLAACGDDDDNGPDPDDGPRLRVVRTAAELDTAFRTVGPGDTIEIDGGFSSSQFVMTRGYEFEADVSPLLVRAAPRATIRPEIVFPANVNGLTFHGHDGTRLAKLSLRGGLTTIVLDDARVLVDTVEIRDPAQDGVEAMGSGSAGRVRGCFIQHVPVAQGGHRGRFGIFTGNNSRMTLDKNTIVNAGDCGMHIGSNDTIRNNNIFGARLHGLYFDALSTSPDVSCNNCFQSGTANYGTVNDIGVPGDDNFALNPRFCPGSFRLSVNSPLTDANACPTCCLIGALDVEEGCTAAE